MRIELDRLGQLKNYVHMGQGVVLFIAWVLTITIFTRDGQNDGRLGWYFGLCWLTIPILIYLTMVPMWSRARRFANVYAFAALDIGSIILWLSAWAAMASYVDQGKREGDEEGESGCDNFGYGSPGRCQLSTGVTILGVFIMLTFCGTSYFSFRNMMEFRRTGIAPNVYGDGVADNKYDFQAETQGDFDSTMRNDDFDESHVGGRDPRQGYGDSGSDQEYAPLSHGDADMRPQEPMSPLGPTSPSAFAPESYGTQGRFEVEDTGYSRPGGNYNR